MNPFFSINKKTIFILGMHVSNFGTLNCTPHYIDLYNQDAYILYRDFISSYQWQMLKWVSHHVLTVIYIEIENKFWKE